jgi:hypothetical protein
MSSENCPDPGTPRYRLYKLMREIEKSNSDDDEGSSGGRVPGLPE